MNKYYGKILNNIQPYVPGEQPQDKKYIKLNTNENPYPPSPKVIAAIRSASDENLRLYPDPECKKLREVIAEYFKVSVDCIFTGNGSDEILAFSYPAFFSGKPPIIFPDITYSFLPVYAGLFNMSYTQIPLTDNFDIPVDSFIKKKAGGIIIPNPNAPTGKYLSVETIKSILDAQPDIVTIIDEAYIDFGGESAIKFVNDYPNLLVVQTLSKSRALAGLRLGFAVGQPHLINALNLIKSCVNSYTVDRISIAAGIAAFNDDLYFKNVNSKIIKTRERIVNELNNLDFTVIPSKANFIFISHQRINAEDLYLKLKERGVLVRYFKKPRIDNYLRVSIGNDSEMNKFLKVIGGICKCI